MEYRRLQCYARNRWSTIQCHWESAARVLSLPLSLSLSLSPWLHFHIPSRVLAVVLEPSVWGQGSGGKHNPLFHDELWQIFYGRLCLVVHKRETKGDQKCTCCQHLLYFCSACQVTRLTLEWQALLKMLIGVALQASLAELLRHRFENPSPPRPSSCSFKWDDSSTQKRVVVVPTEKLRMWSIHTGLHEAGEQLACRQKKRLALTVCELTSVPLKEESGVTRGQKGLV